MADPANRSTNAAGGKVYTHPSTGEVFDSVTTILDLVDKDALKYWSARLAADAAFEHLPQLVASLLVPDCGNTYNRCYAKHGQNNRCERCPCGECERCWHRRLAYRHNLESKRRAEEGTEVHQAIQHWVTSGGQVVSLTEPAKPYFESFLAWVHELDLYPNGQPGYGDWEQLEVTVINRDHMYAGTSDGAVWIHRGRTEAADQIVTRVGGPTAEKILARIDYKTREKPDEALYADMPLQGVAYERCHTVMLADGREFEAPSTDVRAVLQLRPGTYSFKLMLSDDETFDAFLGILRAYRWVHGPGKYAFNIDAWAPSFPTLSVVPDPPSPQTYVEVDPWADDPAGIGVGFAAAQEAETAAPTGPLVQPTLSDGDTDPFAVHNHPAQVAADGRRPPRKGTPKPATTTLDSLRNFSPGPRDPAALDEPIPF